MNLTEIILHTSLWLQSLTWTDAGEIFFVAMSVIGQQFISSRKSRGFHFWLVGNIVAIGVFFSLGRYPMMALYCYFAYMSIKGITNWRRLEQGEGTASLQPVPTASVRA